MTTRVRSWPPLLSPTRGDMMPLTRHWVLPSDVAAITPVVGEIVALCEAEGFSPRQCRLNVPVAVTEALANAMLRGNANDPARRVEVRVQICTECLQVDVADEGTGFDLETAGQCPEAADWLEREDGRGVFLMRQLMDRVENGARAGCPGHELRLILRRP